jgi:uncharacterized protein YegP (UPF0339 family)
MNTYFTVFQSRKNNQWYWNLRSHGNHEIIASGEGYTSKANCLYAVGLVMDTTRQTPVHDVGLVG